MSADVILIGAWPDGERPGPRPPQCREKTPLNWKGFSDPCGNGPVQGESSDEGGTG